MGKLQCLVKFKPVSLSSFEFFVTIVSMGMVMLLPFYLAQGYTLEREIGLLRQFYWAIAYVVLFTSILSYYMWHKGIAELGADRTGQFTHLYAFVWKFFSLPFFRRAVRMVSFRGNCFDWRGEFMCRFLERVLKNRSRFRSRFSDVVALRKINTNFLNTF